MAGIFAVRTLLFTVLERDRPDARGLWLAARTYPGDVYRPAAEFIAAHHGLLPPPQGPGYLGLPTNILLGLPLRSLDETAFVNAWVLIDAACLVAAAVLLMRLLEPLSPLARAAGWASAAAFPPVFAELDAGQRGGPILVLAVLAMRLARRPGLAGALAGAAASLKVYPAAMVLGLPRARFLAAAALTAAGLLALAFLPVGGPAFYAQHVFLPALSPNDADCAIDSVRSLWARSVGGEPYWWIGGPGALVRVQSPIHLPLLAQVLTYLTLAVLVASAVLAARLAGWGTPYALAVTFALGALVPGEVYPYQFLPLLPLIVMVLTAAVTRRRWGVVLALAASLLAFVRPPCEMPFPNLWTVGALAAFAIGAGQYRLFVPADNRR